MVAVSVPTTFDAITTQQHLDAEIPENTVPLDARERRTLHESNRTMIPIPIRQFVSEGGTCLRPHGFVGNCLERWLD
jgi:hypothetical protein